MCSGRLCGMVGLLLSVEKLLRGTGLLVAADWTVRRALHQRHWHPGVSARADHSHNSTSVTVSPRIPAHGWFRSHLRREIIDEDEDDQTTQGSTDTVGCVDSVKCWVLTYGTRFKLFIILYKINVNRIINIL